MTLSDYRRGRRFTQAALSLLLIAGCATHDWRHHPATRDRLVTEIIETERLPFTLADLTQAALRYSGLCSRLDRMKREHEYISWREETAPNPLAYAEVVYSDLVHTAEYVRERQRIGGWEVWEYEVATHEIGVLLDTFAIAYYWCPEHELAVRAAVGTDQSRVR